MPDTRLDELRAEQAYIEAAYARLDEIKAEAEGRAADRARNKETSFQGVYERDVAMRVALERARSLEIGDEALCFGRTDHDNGDRYYIGRRAVFDRTHTPIVIDWRVPSAEPFYRATAMHSLGLTLRRHFLCEGRRLLSMEDEAFDVEGSGELMPGSGALTAAMERPRTGRMRDIVATVQAEQDEIIRDSLEGLLAVQGGPGTGKTAVALHRAAFLLFTHRRKLERQGMLVVGPNRRFLRYIDQVLPALGEGGVRLATLQDLGPKITVTESDPWDIARLKGDARLARVVVVAVRAYPRELKRDVSITIDATPVTLRAYEVNKLVAAARRNRRTHNARRAMLMNILTDRLFVRYRNTLKKKLGNAADFATMSRRDASRALRENHTFLKVVNDVWPPLTPQQVIADLLSSRARLADAARDIMKERDSAALWRERGDAWTAADVPLLDEAAVLLGAVNQPRKIVNRDDDTDEVTTYGHVVVDEAQDLTPMALRMIARRSRTASITLVGDLAQATGPTTPASWDVILSQLPGRGGARVRELSVNYRTPGPAMDVAARVLAVAAPDLKPPRSARLDGEPIRYLEGDTAVTVARLADEQRERGIGTMAIIVARTSLEQITKAAGEPDDTIAVLTAEEAKGLEFDYVVVVEPADLIAESTQGLRALYIAITRATHEVVVAHAEPLPSVLLGEIANSLF